MIPSRIAPARDASGRLVWDLRESPLRHGDAHASSGVRRDGYRSAAVAIGGPPRGRRPARRGGPEVVPRTHDGAGSACRLPLPRFAGSGTTPSTLAVTTPMAPADPTVAVTINPPRRLRGLDSLRGVAIATVILFHVQLHFPTPKLLKRLALLGYNSVQLFFIVSDITICYM